MAWYEKLRGTIETIFQIGFGGPNLKNSSGVIEARNSDDSDYAVVRGATPVASNDLVTKAYADGLQQTGAIRTIKFSVGTTTASSTSTVPANAIVLDCIVSVTTAYTAGATISVGNTTDASLIQTTSDNDPQTVGVYSKEQITDWGASALTVQATISGTPTEGAADIIVLYSEPNS